MEPALAQAEVADDASLLTSLVPRTRREAWGRALLEHGGMRGLVLASDERLAEHLSRSAIMSLRAALEVGSRYHGAREERRVLQTPTAIADYLRPQLGHLSHERFLLLCFNSRSLLLRAATVADGSIDQCVVDPRKLFAIALNANATAIVLAHNHPSGSAEPSTQDLELTRRIGDAAQALCICLLDHIIIGAGPSYVSFAARNLALHSNSR